MKKRFAAMFFAVMFMACTVCHAAGDADLRRVTEKEDLSLFSAIDPIRDIRFDSRGIYIMNLETNCTVLSKNGNEKMYPAAMTMLMTALIALEKCPDPKNTVLTYADAPVYHELEAAGASRMILTDSEKLTVYDLSVCILFSSFCNAAEMLALHFGGGDDAAFVSEMNKKAASLGMTGTHYSNAYGLHSEDHYTTPSDTAKLLAEAIKDPILREILSLKSYTVPKTNRSAPRNLIPAVNIFSPQSRQFNPAFVGGKSGFTDESGSCLATFSSLSGMSFITVFMGGNLDTARDYSGQNMAFFETKDVTDYMYENYTSFTVAKKGDVAGYIKVFDSDFSVPAVYSGDFVYFGRKDNGRLCLVVLPEYIEKSEVHDAWEAGDAIVFFDEHASSSVPLVMSYDGSEIKLKSTVEKTAEKAFGSVSKIFSENRSFTVLVMITLAVSALYIPILKLCDAMKKSAENRPRH